MSSSRWTRVMPMRLVCAVHLDLEPAVLADGQVVLGDLVALHEIGVVVVLAVELGLGRRSRS